MTHENASTPTTSGETIAPIVSLERLSTAWTIVTGKLRFSRRTLWLMLITSNGQPLHAVRLDDAPAAFEEEVAENLMDVVRELSHDQMTVAFLFSRPGTGPCTADDLSWAAGISAHLVRNGLPAWPVHLANDEWLRPSTPADFAAAG